MRMVVALLVVVVACDKGRPAPQATGSNGSESATVAPGDAAMPADASSDATDGAASDGAVATGPVITRAGVGTLGHFEWWKGSDEEVLARIEKGLAGIAGIKASFDVMDVAGNIEREEGYFSVKRGKEELVQLLRMLGPPDGDAPAAVIVWTPDIPTGDGSRVGDKLSVVLAKHPDLKCEMDEDGIVAQFIAVDLTCTSASEPEITYILNVKGVKAKQGVVKPAALRDVPLIGIAHTP